MLNKIGPIAVALVLMLGACGGGTSDTPSPSLPTLSDDAGAAEGTTTTTTEAVDPEEAFQEYSECMREHGIDMPDPGIDDGGGTFTIGGDALDPGAFEEAAAECDPILEAAFGEFELSPEQEAEMMDQQLAFARCMRDEGIEWPDPDTAGAVAIEIPDDVDTDTLNEAMEKCSEGAFGADGGISVDADSVSGIAP